MTVLPVRSTRRAPAGTVSAPLRPTWVMRVPSTTKAESPIGVPPSPVISRAPSNTVVACADADDGIAAIANRAKAIARAHDNDPRCMESLPVADALVVSGNHTGARLGRLVRAHGE